MSTSTLRTVERLGEERRGTPKATLGSSDVSFVERPGVTAAVTLDIGDRLLVAGSAEAIGLLRLCLIQRAVTAWLKRLHT